MKLVGLSRLEAFGKKHAAAMNDLAALVALIQAAGSTTAEAFAERLPHLVVEIRGSEVELMLPNGRCRIVLHFAETLDTVYVAAISALRG